MPPTLMCNFPAYPDGSTCAERSCAEKARKQNLHRNLQKTRKKRVFSCVFRAIFCHELHQLWCNFSSFLHWFRCIFLGSPGKSSAGKQSRGWRGGTKVMGAAGQTPGKGSRHAPGIFFSSFWVAGSRSVKFSFGWWDALPGLKPRDGGGGSVRGLNATPPSGVARERSLRVSGEGFLWGARRTAVDPLRKMRIPPREKIFEGAGERKNRQEGRLAG